MKVYEKQRLACDAKGFFRWHGGKQIRFGHDPAKARMNAARVLALWERMVANGETWTETTWQICTALRKGERSVTLAPNPDMIGAESYLHWIERHRLLAGDLLEIVPSDSDAYDRGAAEASAAREKQLAFVDVAYPAFPRVQSPTGATLYQALDAFRDSLPDSTSWDITRRRQVRFLREHLADMPLSALDLATMEKHLTFLARRPARFDGKPISRAYCKVLCSTLKMFWRWLHRTNLFAWRRPEEWDELRVRIANLPSDARADLAAVHVQVYSVEELAVLYRYATPAMRLFVLLGLNCGFATSEFSTLAEKEVDLDAGMIRRVRHKSRVYSEWRLFQATIAGLRWAQARKAKTGATCDALIVTSAGNCYNDRTSNGGNMNRIALAWRGLFKRIRKDHPDFPYRAPKFLRKTGADMVRKVSNGETAGLFLAHGNPVRADPLANAYSNRDFASLHRALVEVELQLQPMFAAVENPFPG